MDCKGSVSHCGLCMDACNHVIAKTGRQPWLISWDSISNNQALTFGNPPLPFRRKRPRTVVYAAALVGLVALMIGGLVQRPRLNIVAEHDRAHLYVPLSGGGTRNAYTIHVANKVADAGIVRLTIHGIPGAVLSTESQAADASGALLLPVPTDDNGEFRIFVTVRSPSAAGNDSLSMDVERLSDKAKAETAAVFISGQHPL
jgi:polyferredoxin